MISAEQLRKEQEKFLDELRGGEDELVLREIEKALIKASHKRPKEILYYCRENPFTKQKNITLEVENTLKQLGYVCEEIPKKPGVWKISW